MFEELSMVTRIVEDQGEAVSFYTKILGFEIRRDHPGPHGRFVSVAPKQDKSTELVLISPDGFDEEDAERLSEAIGLDGGLIYHVDNCQATYKALRENGVKFQDEPTAMPWGVQTSFTDPDGYEITIQEPISNPEL